MLIKSCEDSLLKVALELVCTFSSTGESNCGRSFEVEGWTLEELFRGAAIAPLLRLFLMQRVWSRGLQGKLSLNEAVDNLLFDWLKFTPAGHWTLTLKNLSSS